MGIESADSQRFHTKEVTYIVTYLQRERGKERVWEMVVENAISDMLTNKYG